MPSDFGGSSVSEVSMDHIFPQGMLAAITLVGGGPRDGARARATCELGLLLCSEVITTLSGMGSGPKVLGQKP